MKQAGRPSGETGPSQASRTLTLPVRPFICMTSMNGVTISAPKMPVMITNTAVKKGSPPSDCETAIATPAVADFGRKDSIMSRRRSETWPSTITEAIATIEPTRSATEIGSSKALTSFRFLYKGTAIATVAGPSKKWINWAPAK